MSRKHCQIEAQGHNWRTVQNNTRSETSVYVIISVVGSQTAPSQCTW